jgi:tetratricopeptide (TPR) repeat protein
MRACYLLLALFVFSASAQQRKHFVINASTPEGELLQNIGQEPDESKKLALMQDFVAKYPKHEGAAWVYDQMQAVFVKQKDYDKALDAGEKALASDPEDLDAAYSNLKSAEGKDDAALVKVWSVRTSAIARKVGTAPESANDEDKQRVEFAKGVDTYTEYALYAAALKAKEPQNIVDLVDALEKLNTKSQYLPQLSGNYLNALAQAGQAPKACQAAERFAAKDSKDADALLFAADCSLRQNQIDKAISSSSKAIDTLNSKAKPEGLSDADWAAKKQAMVGRASWIAGVGYGIQQKFGPADKALRVGLPSVKGNDQLTATALFYLGLSNYQLGKTLTNKAQMRDGLRFFEQCAAIKSPMQDQAQKNVRAIRGELGIVK